MDLGPVLDEGARHDPADAGGTRGHQDAQAFGGEFHRAS
jgi:hypothetical protein